MLSDRYIYCVSLIESSMSYLKGFYLCALPKVDRIQDVLEVHVGLEGLTINQFSFQIYVHTSWRMCHQFGQKLEFLVVESERKRLLHHH